MIGEIEDLSELRDEEFYNSIEKRYEKNLRYHDMDNCYILAGVSEHEIIGVFEESNNEYSSDELIALKKELCNFIGENVSLKVGTKGKTITLLCSIRDYYRKKIKMGLINHNLHLLLEMVVKLLKPIYQSFF
jgi:hypothetical protein